MKTISEIAKLQGISKPAVRQRLKALGFDIAEFPMEGNKRLVPDEAFERLQQEAQQKQETETESETKTETESKTVTEVEFLRKQVAELMELNKELTASLGREQTLCAQRAQEVDRLRKQLSGEVEIIEEVQEQPEDWRSKSLWDRIFKR